MLNDPCDREGCGHNRLNHYGTEDNTDPCYVTTCACPDFTNRAVRFQADVAALSEALKILERQGHAAASAVAAAIGEITTDYAMGRYNPAPGNRLHRLSQ